MVLRKKVFATLAAALLILIGLLYIVGRASVLNGFIAVEQQEMSKDVARVVNALKRVEGQLKRSNQEYAAWFDTYEFVQNPAQHQAYLQSNYAPEVFTAEFDTIVMLNQRKKIVFARIFDTPLASTKHIVLPDDPDLYEQLTLLADAYLNKAGLIIIANKPMLVSFQPILKNVGENQSAGIMIAALFLDENLVARLSAETNLTFTLGTYDLHQHDQPAVSLLNADHPTANPINIYHPGNNTIVGSTALVTLDGTTSLHLHVASQRSVYTQGMESLQWMLGSALLVGLVSSFLGYFIFERQVMQPILRLDDQVRSIADHGKVGERVSLAEVGSFRPLGDNINAMLGAVEKAQRNVLESEARFRVMVESAPEAIVIIDAGLEINIEVNPKALQLFGYNNRQEFLALNFYELAPELQPDGQLTSALFDQSWSKALARESVTFEAALLRYNGEEMPCEIRLVRFPGEERSLLRASITDITERKQAQARVWQAQKLESLGLLAGGIAHDFNNILTGIMGQTSLALRKLPSENTARQHIEKAVASTQRAAVLTRQLLAYAGRGTVQFEVLDLNKLMQETANLLETALPKHVRLQQQLAGNLPGIHADLGQAQQVVMNLVTNAAEAIPLEIEGLVVVTTGMTLIQEKQAQTYVNGEQATPGRYVWLEVKDNGAGMSRSTLDRIFDPFFTTKQHGNGLGLSATLGIMRTHGGGVQVNSQPGQGTTFRILFPAKTIDNSLLAPPEPTRRNREEMPREDIKGVVLVIDDEEPIRQTVSDILESSQIRVLCADNGRSGLEKYRAHQAQIDVVIIDMRMPLMDGAATFHALHAINPDIRVILSSAYSENQATQPIIQQGLATFLPKPYESSALLARVQQLINKAQR